MGIVYFLEKGKLKKEKAEPKKIKSLLANKKCFWIDASRANLDNLAKMGSALKLHPLTIEDIQRRKTRIKIEMFKEYIFVVLYGISKELKNYEIDFVLGKNFVFSVHRAEDKVAEKLLKSKDRIKHLLEKGPDFLMHGLMELELDNYFPVLAVLDKKREYYEKLILRNASSNKLLEISNLKEKLNKFKRSSATMREKILFLSRMDSFISKKAIPFYRDLYDTITRINDELDTDRDGLNSLIDLHMSVMSNKMNEIMKVLAVISTIMLPLSVITGIYGMNFRFLPLAHHAFGFWIIIGLMLAVLLSMIAFFKKKGWF